MNADAGGKLRVEVTAFKPHYANTLRGFVTIEIPALHLRVCGITAHEKNGKRWIGMPGRPQVDSDGSVKRDERGRVAYSSILEFTHDGTRRAFSDRVVESLLVFAPAAFEATDEDSV